MTTASRLFINNNYCKGIKRELFLHYNAKIGAAAAIASMQASKRPLTRI
jgi:hypothetical protein